MKDKKSQAKNLLISIDKSIQNITGTQYGLDRNFEWFYENKNWYAILVTIYEGRNLLNRIRVENGLVIQ